MSFMALPISDTPVAVLDFETTGLSPRTGSRVVEVGVARVDPGQEPRVVLDTLIHPEGPVHATDIHGISDLDVADAPRFRQVVGAIVEAVEGAVVLSYNASFDIAFLVAELSRLNPGEIPPPPHLCLMWLRPLLGLGQRASLCATCEEFGLPGATHAAADDATVGAYLWLRYRDHATTNGIRTFGDLASRGTHKYLKTLTSPAYSRESRYFVLTSAASSALKTRRGRTAFVPTPVPHLPFLTEDVLRALATHFGPPPLAARRRAYWHSLTASLSDLKLSSEETTQLRRERETLGLSENDVRALHSRFVGQILLQMVEDQVVDRSENDRLRELFAGMRRLGWAPGD